MRSLLPVLAAGGTFAAAATIGLAAGVLVASRTNQSLWVPGGLLVGAALGGYSALRLLARSIR